MEEGDRLMAYWLFKSEPDSWGWDHRSPRARRARNGTGVRNYQARNNMRAMKVGDQGFFYHSNIGKAVVGIVEVIAESASRQHDGRSALGLRDAARGAAAGASVTLESARCSRAGGDGAGEQHAPVRAAGDGGRNGGSSARWAG
jgi:hypothetical protein